MIGTSRYNTITERLREEIVECIISRPNVNPSFVSSDVVMIFNPESNQNYFSNNVNGDLW